MTDIDLDNKSDREILVLLVQTVNYTNECLTKQNGRIRSLEDWRNIIAGGLGIVGIISAILLKLTV